MLLLNLSGCYHKKMTDPDITEEGKSFMRTFHPVTDIVQRELTAFDVS